MGKALTPSFESFYDKIKEILESARNRSYMAVNFEMVQAYWNIGRSIVEEEQAGRERAEYGKYLLSNLPKYERAAFRIILDTLQNTYTC